VIRKDDGPADASPLSNFVVVEQQSPPEGVVPAGAPMLKSQKSEQVRE
jgi:hypothetical protein